MSNTVVGNVYDRIIKEVVETSRVDFEESGIDDSVLEELRTVSRVISLVALFPDPIAFQNARDILSVGDNSLKPNLKAAR